MVLKKNLVYTAMAMESQRNQDGHVFALQETRNRLQNVLERRRQAAAAARPAGLGAPSPAEDPASDYKMVIKNGVLLRDGASPAIEGARPAAKFSSASASASAAATSKRRLSHSSR